MSDLGELLGTLMVSLAKARQIVDAETAVIAEWYRSHPLLEGIGIPRIRVPEMTIEVPLLLKAGYGGEPNEIAEPKAIAEAAGAELLASAQRAGATLPAEVVASVVSAVASGIAELRVGSAGVQSIPREAVARIAEAAAAHALSASPATAQLTGDRLRVAISDVRRRVLDIAEVKPSRPPRIEATLMTSEVKEKADPNTVTRIRLTLREEGLEWSAGHASDGTHPRRLSPE